MHLFPWQKGLFSSEMLIGHQLNLILRFSFSFSQMTGFASSQKFSDVPSEEPFVSLRVYYRERAFPLKDKLIPLIIIIKKKNWKKQHHLQRCSAHCWPLLGVFRGRGVGGGGAPRAPTVNSTFFRKRSPVSFTGFFASGLLLVVLFQPLRLFCPPASLSLDDADAC